MTRRKGYRVWIILTAILAIASVVAINSCSPPAPVSTYHATPEFNVKPGFPPLLSQTGVFADLPAKRLDSGLMEYGVNLPFYADGATKRRWIALPQGGKIHFAEQGEWSFPAGTLFVKDFEMPVPGERAIRLETRLLVYEGSGIVRGASYRWRADGSDADLVVTRAAVNLKVGSKERGYDFPGENDCVTCHTLAAGGVLGVKTRQINGRFGSNGENQLVSWSQRGYFDSSLQVAPTSSLPCLVAMNDRSASLTDRARSYLDVNCSNCHRPGGSPGNFDMRFDTPLLRQNLLGGSVMINLGVDHARVFAPADVWRSIALNRVETLELTKMPPLGHENVDHEGAQLLREWILSQPGRPVLEPPSMSPAGGEYARALQITLNCPTAGAVIHYTIDGSQPTRASATYVEPVVVYSPTTLRACAYKDGFTPSICINATYLVNN